MTYIITWRPSYCAYCCAMPYLKSMNYLSYQYVKPFMRYTTARAVLAGLARFKMLNCCLQWFKVSLRTLATAYCCLPHLFTTAIPHATSEAQWLKWFCEAGGLTWRSQVGANPIPYYSNPTNLALFRHKITLYRFNHGAHTIAGSSNRSRGAEPLAPTDE